MKDWVKPFLLQRAAEDLAESTKDESEKQEWMILKSRMLDDKEILYHELISCLNCHLGMGVGEFDIFFYNVFGSVLADLPEKVFRRLCSMKNLFFVYTPSPRAETKVLELKHDVTEQKLQVVVFPYDSGLLPSRALRGEIVHQLVQVHTGLLDLTAQEDQIACIAMEWGFEEEIKAAGECRKAEVPGRRVRILSKEGEEISSRVRGYATLAMKQPKGTKETVFELRRAVTTIGRRAGNDIVLKHPTVSRRHAEICLEEGGYFLYDVASTNGTRLNGRYISKEQLSDGDVVKIGPFTFTFGASLSFPK